MPPRRGKSRKMKQKQAITTRLMEINLRLDDYVYKKKPISIQDAQAYISEISMYESQCLKDERSLQVIEKLTRCMKSIINEEQNDDNCYLQQNTNTAYCPSPTYSLVEEDVEPNAYSHDHDIPDTQVKHQKTVEAISEQTTIGTIDLCGEEDNEREHIEFHVDVEMHRALSNLSLRDQDPLNTTDVHSQSILDNFEQNPDILPNLEIRDHRDTEKALIAVHPALTLTTSTATPAYEDGLIPDLLKSKCNKNEISLIRIDKSSKSNLKFIDLTKDEKPWMKKGANVKKVVRFQTNMNQQTSDAAVANKYNKNIMKKNTEKRITNSRGDIKKQDNIENKKKYVRQVNNQKKNKKQINIISEDVILPKIQAKVNVPILNSTIAKKIDTTIMSCSKYYDEISKSKNTQELIPTSNKFEKRKNHCVSIYSNNTENDLSWMENIRFVREIENEEIDIKLSGLDESFWDDLSFPNDWDEHEFDV